MSEKGLNYRSLERLLADLLPTQQSPNMQQRIKEHIAFVRLLRGMSGPPQRAPEDGVEI